MATAFQVKAIAPAAHPPPLNTAKPVTEPNILKFASLASVSPPAEILIKAVAVFAAGTDQLRRVVVAGMLLDISVQLAPLSSEYSTVWLVVTPALSQVITSATPGVKASFPLG